MGSRGGQAPARSAPCHLPRPGPRRVEPGSMRGTPARRVLRRPRSALAIALPGGYAAGLRRGGGAREGAWGARRGEERMNRVLAHTGVEFPIVQAPMGWIARSQLASAVSNAGGLGIIETSSGEVDAVRDEIRKMRDLTD